MIENIILIGAVLGASISGYCVGFSRGRRVGR